MAVIPDRSGETAEGKGIQLFRPPSVCIPFPALRAAGDDMAYPLARSTARRTTALTSASLRKRSCLIMAQPP